MQEPLLLQRTLKRCNPRLTLLSKSHDLDTKFLNLRLNSQNKVKIADTIRNSKKHQKTAHKSFNKSVAHKSKKYQNLPDSVEANVYKHNAFKEQMKEWKSSSSKNFYSLVDNLNVKMVEVRNSDSKWTMKLWFLCRNRSD